MMSNEVSDRIEIYRLPCSNYMIMHKAIPEGNQYRRYILTLHIQPLTIQSYKCFLTISQQYHLELNVNTSKTIVCSKHKELINGETVEQVDEFF